METAKQIVKEHNRRLAVLFVAGIVFVAFNLRPAITSVGPLVSMIQADLGLSHWSAGLLTSLPLIAFALLSPVVPSIANILTNTWTLIGGLVILLAGFFIRSTTVVALLFLGTFFIGVGIAVLNVILPVIVKDKFPGNFALMTSVYTTSMSIVAALASGLSVPLASGLHLGWRNTLLVWSVPAVLAVVLWLIILKTDRNGKPVHPGKMRKENNCLWKSPLAWQVAFFFGFQSFIFYVTITWFPEILHNKGLSLASAGWLLSFAQLTGLPANFFIPILAERTPSQEKVALGISLCTVIGYLIVLLNSSFFMLVFGTVFIGLGMGGTFSLAMSYIGMRARSAKQAAQLSGMAQSLGYIFAASGPICIGYLFDYTGVWLVPLITIITAGSFMTLFGILAGRNRYV